MTQPKIGFIGLGLMGSAMVGRLQDKGYSITALGETVTIASRLEHATKRQLTDCLASQATLKAAGRGHNPGMRREINVPGLSEPVIAYAIDIDQDDSDTADEATLAPTA